MIEQLRLRGFRGYRDEHITFTPGLNLIEGENDAGKTSLFYGIEFALFGAVSGFRSLNALAGGHDAPLVELTFRGLDGTRYRITRALPGGDGETRLEAERGSGWQDALPGGGARDLTRAISALTGLRRRLFESAVYARQGELTSLLRGDPRLDIALGVTAATECAVALRALAAKAAREAEALPKTLEAIEALAERRAQLATTRSEKAALVERLEARRARDVAERERIARLSLAAAPLLHRLRATDAADAALQQIKAERDARQTALEETREQFGSSADIVAELEQIQAEETCLDTSERGLERDWGELWGRLRSLDEARGDLEGRRRRRALDLERCDICSRPVDPAWSRAKIDDWRCELHALEQDIAALRSDEADLRARVRGLETDRQRVALRENELQSRRAQIEQLAYEIESRASDLAEAQRKLKVARAATEEAAAAWQRGLSAETGGLSDALRGAARAPLSADALETALETARGRNGVELEATEEALARWRPELEALTESLTALEARAAALESERAAQEAFASAAAHRRELADTFEAVQRLRRGALAQTLTQELEALYPRLAGEPTLPQIALDSERYTLEIDGIAAHLYRGGGRQLLLGLALRAAVARAVGPAAFLLLDEPTYGLDAARRRALFDGVVDLAPQILLISHHPEAKGRRICIERGPDGPQHRIVEG